jgi:elongation factor Ts
VFSAGEAAGDFEAAARLLRLKGVKDVTSRAIRTAANGLVTAALEGTGAGVLVELNCEAGAALKERLELGPFALLEGGYITSYLHRSDRALPPAVGVLVLRP